MKDRESYNGTIIEKSAVVQMRKVKKVGNRKSGKEEGRDKRRRDKRT